MKNLDYLWHGLFWLLYSGICYALNVISHPETKYIQIAAALPLLMLVFYAGYALAGRFAAPQKKGSTLLVAALLCVASIAVAYGWVHYLMPSLSIHIAYRYFDSVTIFVQEVWPIFLRYMAYGIAFYALKHSSAIAKLKSKLLAMQVLPHALYNIWAHICGLLAPIPIHVQQQIQGFMTLQAYSVRIPDLPEDLVWADLEMAKLRSWLATADEDIRITVTGESWGHRVQPFSLITLVENARKHHRSDTPIQVHVAFRKEEIHIRCQNQIDPHDRHRPGLGTGLHNLRKRLRLQSKVSGTLSTDIQNNHYITTLIYKQTH